MELREEAKDYILKFLTGYEDERLFRRFRIGYTADTALFSRYDLVFIPSGFFSAGNYGSFSSLPVGKIPEIDGVPFLYGSNRIERQGNTIVVYADLVATTFFFISRYEEICRREARDEHGRFPGKESLLYKNNLIFRPFLDEYPALVRKWLTEAGIENLPEPPVGIAKLWLTHDVDAPFYGKGLRAFFRESLKGRGPRCAFRFFKAKMETDPYYTFPFLLEEDGRCKAQAQYPVEAVYFLKAGGESPYDKPVYSLRTKRIKKLINLLRENKASLGLHGSYSSGGKKADPYEKRRLEWALGKKVFFARNHYLRSTEPENFLSLENMGITDDFTMGYADVSGFRMGTARPVIWIDPFSGRLSRLVLHPLIIMDNTLYNPAYMGLTEEEAKALCINLFQTIQKSGGEVCLLWHNTSALEGEYPRNPSPWIRGLYSYLLDYLIKM